jgi:hypothetical protein
VRVCVCGCGAGDGTQGLKCSPLSCIPSSKDEEFTKWQMLWKGSPGISSLKVDLSTALAAWLSTAQSEGGSLERA